MFSRLIRTALTFLAAILIGAVFAEALYRLNLWHKDLRIYITEKDLRAGLSIHVTNRSLWDYDADFGFRYTDRTDKRWASISGRGIIGCGGYRPLNHDGSPGLSNGDYQSADVKIVVIGDSFSVTVDEEDRTWPFVLQEALQAQLHRSVHVLNLARDGTGIAQHMRSAIIAAERYRPDLIVIAFNTGLMTARRIWRSEIEVSGETRSLTSLINTATPDARDRAHTYDTQILEPKIDREWCDRNATGGPLDEVASSALDRYLRLGERRYWIGTMERSFLWNRFIHGNKFYDATIDGITPRPYDAKTILQEKAFLEDIATLQNQRMPHVVLVHLPTTPEIASGREYASREAETFTDTISRLSGLRIHGLLPLLATLNPMSVSKSADDLHPTETGISAYAEAVSQILIPIIREQKPQRHVPE